MTSAGEEEATDRSRSNQSSQGGVTLETMTPGTTEVMAPGVLEGMPPGALEAMTRDLGNLCKLQMPGRDSQLSLAITTMERQLVSYSRLLETLTHSNTEIIQELVPQILGNYAQLSLYFDKIDRLEELVENIHSDLDSLERRLTEAEATSSEAGGGGPLKSVLSYFTGGTGGSAASSIMGGGAASGLIGGSNTGSIIGGSTASNILGASTAGGVNSGNTGGSGAQASENFEPVQILNTQQYFHKR